MTAMPFSFPIFKAFATTGTLGPLAGGLLHTFEAGTSTPLAVYQDAALTVPHTNPVVLDSNGQATIYIGPNAYKMRLDDSTGAVQPGWPIDGLQKDTDTLRADLASSSGSSLVGFTQSGTGAVARTVQDKLRESVSAKDLGVTGDGATDDRAALNAAFDKAVAGGKTLVVPDGVYLCNEWLAFPSGLKMVCSPGAVFKLGAATSPGGFVIGGYTLDLVSRPFEDVEIYDMTLDCNNIAGENGFSGLNGVNVKLYNPKIINCIHSPTLLGGRAMQFEGGIVDGVHVYNLYLENCSIGINSQASPIGTTKAANVNYYDTVMKNVDIPFNIDAGYANPSTSISENMSTFVCGAELSNCGKITWPGNSGATGGGIVCGDRGAGLRITGLRVINDVAYGSIGGLVRGVMFNVTISDVEFSCGGGATAVYDFNPVGFGSASASEANPTVFSTNVRVTGTVGHIVKAGATLKVGAARLQADINGTVTTGFVDANAGAATTAYGDFTSVSTLASTGQMLLPDMLAGGNAFANFANQLQTGYRKIWHSKTAPDETATTLASVYFPVNSRVSIGFTMTSLYPQSGAQGGTSVQSGIITACMDGTGNFASTVSQINASSALSGVASMAVAASVAMVGNDLVISVTQNSENVDAGTTIVLVADIVYALGGVRTQPKIALL